LSLRISFSSSCFRGGHLHKFISAFRQKGGGAENFSCICFFYLSSAPSDPCVNVTYDIFCHLSYSGR
jgi:hypothetical protein